MSNNHRELTGREKQRIKKLITSLCANHHKEYDCLPLDCECPMFGLCYTNSALCRYFRKSVLLEDAELEAVFTRTPTTNCKQCGKLFPVDGKRVYCSDCCAEEARRQQTAARVRKHREKKIGLPQNRRFCGKRRRSEMSSSCRLRRDEQYAACNDDM